jgi:energy-coupling factor transporter ATP-binding protein EcfA2
MIGVIFEEIEFADGTKVSMKAGDILVLTGPNEGGKSNVLRNLRPRLIDLEANQPSDTIKSTRTKRTGSFAEVLALLNNSYRVTKTANREGYDVSSPSGFRITEQQWNSGRLPDGLTNMFSALLTARERFELIADRENVPLERASTPVQMLRYAEQTEKAIGALSRDAFGLEIYCHQDGGQLQLKVGKRTEFPGKDDYRTRSEFIKGAALSPLRTEGDGIQSFTGILLAALVQPLSVTLIDEPEAFLHPPQARRLAQNLVDKTRKDGQLVVATHDYDFIRGLVSAGGSRVHVVRIRRINKVTSTTHLPNDKLEQLWSGPFMSTSDVLSALFHDVAVLCEGDSDVRFLRAVLDAVEAVLAKPLPDILFFSCGSKEGSTRWRLPCRQ